MRNITANEDFATLLIRNNFVIALFPINATTLLRDIHHSQGKLAKDQKQYW